MDVITGNTEIGNTKQDLIAAMVQRELAFKAKLTPYFTDLSSMVGPGMQSISVPKLSSFTVADRAEGSAGEISALTSSVDKLELNQNLYVSWLIDPMTAIQSNIPAQLEFARRAAAAQARKIDELIITELGNIAHSFINVGADANVTYANVLKMVKELEENDAEMSDCVWLVSPTQKEAIFGLAEFKNQYQFGQAVLPSGVIGTILGIPVVMHSGMSSVQVYLAEKSSLAYAFQKSASYAEQDEIAYGVGAKRAAIDQLFGLKGMQLAQKGAAAGKSPLVIGLND
jgi:HK97 family phage major capsid protein